MSGVRCQVSGVSCQLSGVSCQVSHVMCQVSQVTFFPRKNDNKEKKKMDGVVELVGGGSVINGATPSSFL